MRGDGREGFVRMACLCLQSYSVFVWTIDSSNNEKWIECDYNVENAFHLNMATTFLSGSDAHAHCHCTIIIIIITIIDEMTNCLWKIQCNYSFISFQFILPRLLLLLLLLQHIHLPLVCRSCYVSLPNSIITFRFGSHAVVVSVISLLLEWVLHDKHFSADLLNDFYFTLFL